VLSWRVHGWAAGGCTRRRTVESGSCRGPPGCFWWQRRARSRRPGSVHGRGRRSGGADVRVGGLPGPADARVGVQRKAARGRGRAAGGAAAASARRRARAPGRSPARHQLLCVDGAHLLCARTCLPCSPTAPTVSAPACLPPAASVRHAHCRWPCIRQHTHWPCSRQHTHLIAAAH